MTNAELQNAVLSEVVKLNSIDTEGATARSEIVACATNLFHAANDDAEVVYNEFTVPVKEVKNQCEDCYITVCTRNDEVISIVLHGGNSYGNFTIDVKPKHDWLVSKSMGELISNFEKSFDRLSELPMMIENYFYEVKPDWTTNDLFAKFVEPVQDNKEIVV